MANQHYCIQRIPDVVMYLAQRYHYFFTAHYLNRQLFDTWVEGMDFEYGDIDEWKLLIEHNLPHWILPGTLLPSPGQEGLYDNDIHTIRSLLWSKVESLDRVYSQVADGFLDIDSLDRYRYRRHTRTDYAIEFVGALHEDSRQHTHAARTY